MIKNVFVALTTTAVALSITSAYAGATGSSEAYLSSTEDTIVVDQGMRYHSKTSQGCTIGFVSDNLAYSSNRAVHVLVAPDDKAHSSFRAEDVSEIEKDWEKNRIFRNTLPVCLIVESRLSKSSLNTAKAFRLYRDRSYVYEDPELCKGYRTVEEFFEKNPNMTQG